MLQHGGAAVVSEARIEVNAKVAKSATSRLDVRVPGVLDDVSLMIYRV